MNDEKSEFEIKDEAGLEQAAATGPACPKESASGLKLRPHQAEIFRDQKTGVLVLHWSRQIGKSYTLAAWAVFRALNFPGRLITVLSNSRENGAEFLRKCSEICRLYRTTFSTVIRPTPLRFDDLSLELRIKNRGEISRIKVLAANPRTARGFSGDLILDEFAFHENSAAIWDAAEPILAANPGYLCRIASTGNGHHNMFYRIVADPLESTEEHPPGIANCFKSRAGYKVSRITRTMAHSLGVPIYHLHSRQPITPDEARAQALDKRSYDQNYECSFADESLTLLSHELISAAEDDEIGHICEQDWSPDALELMRGCQGPLYVGFDVGRKVDLSVITVMEKLDNLFLVRGILRIRDMRLPEQEERLGELCRLPTFRRAAIDMTGLGLGLFEYAEQKFKSHRIRGINFASTVPATQAIQEEGRKRESVRVTEAMAIELLRVYEDRRIRHPRDGLLRDDLRKPEKITSPSGRVSIAATRDEAGHADHFWSFALALEAESGPQQFGCETIKAKFGSRKC